MRVIGLDRSMRLAALCAGLVLACPAVLAPALAPALAADAPASSGIPVTVAKTQRQDVPVWLHGLGTVQANYVVAIRPRVDGTLTDVPVKEGQDVTKGQLLAIIDPRPYQAILDAAIAKKQQDEAQLANAKADLDRYASLARNDFASRQQLDTQKSSVKQLTAAMAADQAQIEAAQLNLSFAYITAPFDGRVGLRSVDPGNVVHASEQTQIMSVAQVQPISVTFTLPQDVLPRVTAAMAEGTLPVVAFASDDKTELDRGTLLTVDNAIDTSTGTIKLKATFPNAHRTLWPGQFVRVRLLLGTDRDVVTAPTIAVQRGPSGLYVYQVKPDDTVAVQPVTVAREEGGLSVIAQGLAPGVPVVTGGQSRLQVGTRVAVRDAAQPAAAKAGS